MSQIPLPTRAQAVTLKSVGVKTPQIESATKISDRHISRMYYEARRRGWKPGEEPLLDEHIANKPKPGRPRKNKDLAERQWRILSDSLVNESSKPSTSSSTEDSADKISPAQAAPPTTATAAPVEPASTSARTGAAAENPSSPSAKAAAGDGEATPTATAP